MTEEIFDLAVTLGAVIEEDKAVLRRFCESAERELVGRLKAGVGAADCAPALILAAAWLALADICVGAYMDDGTSFTAGDLTIRAEGGMTALERCTGLRKRAEQVMAPYIRDRGFCFLGVRS